MELKTVLHKLIEKEKQSSKLRLEYSIINKSIETILVEIHRKGKVSGYSMYILLEETDHMLYLLHIEKLKHATVFFPTEEKERDILMVNVQTIQRHEKTTEWDMESIQEKKEFMSKKHQLRTIKEIDTFCDIVYKRPIYRVKSLVEKRKIVLMYINELIELERFKEIAFEPQPSVLQKWRESIKQLLVKWRT